MEENKNVVDNTDLTGHDGVIDNKVNNWISQINVGGTVYDIATHHGITFKDGSGDVNGVMWNGLTDIEIVIPNITDIVRTPIEFIGTVNADGKVMNGANEIVTFEKGNLVFVVANCTFDGKVCESGDMAIYDGSEWKVVTGENQVSIVGNQGEEKTTISIGAAKDVLTVEGKTLALSLDYEDLNNHLLPTKGSVTDINFDTMTVGSVGIKLNKGDDVATTIGEEKSITYGTELADGTVNLTGATGLINGITFGAFNPGTVTTSKGNTERNLAVSGGKLSLTSNQTSGEFVDSVSINPVTFELADDNEEGSIKVLTGITAGEGSEFFNGIHVTTDIESADLTIAGYIAPEGGVSTKYVKGLAGNLTPVTSITDGNFELVSGSELATGFGNESTTGGEVVSSVTVSANNNTSVLNEAKVENHVLSFGVTNVTSSVTTSCGYKSLTKTGFKYTAPKATNTAFTTGGFEKVDDVKYTFGRGKETVYNESSENWKLKTPALTVKYGSYGFDSDGMVANVPAETFIASVTAGSLPSLGESTFTTTDITGTVDTTLSTATLEFNALKSNSINMPGTYSLSTVEADGDITVGKHGALAANTATVDLSEYLKGISITE